MHKGKQDRFSFKSLRAALGLSKNRPKAPKGSTATLGASRETSADLDSSKNSDTDTTPPPNPGTAIGVGPEAVGSGSESIGSTPSVGLEQGIGSLPNAVVQPGDGALNIFPNAANFHLEHFTYVNAPAPQSSWGDSEGWKILLQHTAPNALYDSSARFDPPKCDPDTRTDVLDEIMSWIEDRAGPTRLLCLTGAAGAGKSALQQTIAERCSNEKILAAAFFFSAGDYTRNNLSKVIPTMAYQMAEKDIRFRALLSESVERDPLIFEKSLRTQFDTLIVGPWVKLHGAQGETTQLPPQAVLLDGLDECLDTRRQEELLSAIKDVLLSNPHLPLRIFLSSRPEWAVRTALDPLGYLYHLTYHIRLSDDYDATADIRLMLWRRLKDIGVRSGDPRAHPELWPTEVDIEQLVLAASGQFIYAATVVKYVAEVRGSPVDRLRIVLNWKPGHHQRAKPFAPLDLLYSNIVSTAKIAYEAVDTNEYDFLALLAIFHRELGGHLTGSIITPVDHMEQALGLPDGTYHIVLSDLHALIKRETKGGTTYTFYHRSFSEWLVSHGRAGALFVPLDAADAYTTRHILQCILRQKHAQVEGGTGYQAGLAATFLARMKAVEMAERSLAQPVIDLFLDFIAEEGSLEFLVQSCLAYLDAIYHEFHNAELRPTFSTIAHTYIGLTNIFSAAIDCLRAGAPGTIRGGAYVEETLQMYHKILGDKVADMCT